MRLGLAPPPDRACLSRLGPELLAALEEYVRLERHVQNIVTTYCAPTCAACRRRCCHACFCQESWRAPWLRAAVALPGAIRRRAASELVEGYLARDGCRLRFGRPPVCYEFFCETIEDRLATDSRRYAFRVLSHALSFAGRGAVARTHLVELGDLALLRGARTRRLRERIALTSKIVTAASRLFAVGSAVPDPGGQALLARYFPCRERRPAPGGPACAA